MDQTRERTEMNLKDKIALKKLGWTVTKDYIHADKKDIYGYMNNTYLIEFGTCESNTCCGVDEVGNFEFDNSWDSLPRILKIACFNHLCPPSKRFSILYALEGHHWDALTDILPDCGFIPAGRWKNPGTKNMIQAWYKSSDEPKRRRHSKPK